MFESLQNALSKVVSKLTGANKISQSQIDETMVEIKKALIDADVNLKVIKELEQNIGQKLKNQEVIKSVTAGDMIVKVVHDEIVNILSLENSSADNSQGENQELQLNLLGLSTILMVGLQGSGKTTHAAKLALYLKKQKKKVLLISADTYRPAAREQLKIIANSIDVDFFNSESNDPLEIVKNGLSKAKLSMYDVAIFDTAGRLQIDEEMIMEAKEIKNICKPTETVLVVDSLSGQMATEIASKFNQELDITSIILSRVDGDARGGAALSTRYITQKPIKFLGTGEKVENLEVFDPKRIASRILGMGDIVSLVEKASEAMDKAEAEKAAKKFEKGKFDLNDYLLQIKNVKKIGGISGVMKMMPGFASMDEGMKNKINNFGINIHEAIICSMTKKERRNPLILNASRKKRIAKGSGTSVQEIQKLLKQFEKMQSMVKKASSMGLENLLNKTGLGNLFS